MKNWLNSSQCFISWNLTCLSKLKYNLHLKNVKNNEDWWDEDKNYVFQKDT